MIVNCLLLEEKIEELRKLVNSELDTSPYLVDLLIAKLLEDTMHSYVNNFAQQIMYWKELLKIIKKDLGQEDKENET